MTAQEESQYSIYKTSSIIFCSSSRLHNVIGLCIESDQEHMSTLLCSCDFSAHSLLLVRSDHSNDGSRWFKYSSSEVSRSFV